MVSPLASVGEFFAGDRHAQPGIDPRGRWHVSDDGVAKGIEPPERG
jgi:hypothetical protein